MNNPFIQSVHFRPWSAVFSRVRFACLRGGAFGIALTGLCLAPAAQAQNVNWIQEVGASTGNTPGIYARGSDANVGLNLIPKGAGVVNISGTLAAVNISTSTINGLALSQLVSGTSSGASSIKFGFPDALICSGTDGTVVLWISWSPPDSKVYYDYNLSTNHRIIFNSNGTYNSTSDVGNYNTSCRNKSITQLYTSGQAFNLVGGSGESTAQGDRLTSGTLAVTANSTTSVVSLSTAGVTWGYLASAASYLPNLSSNVISATALTVNGVAITGGAGAPSDRIISGTSSVAATATGLINFTTSGTTTGYFDTTGRLVVPGISVTTLNGISSTNGYFGGNVGIGTTAPSYTLHVNGAVGVLGPRIWDDGGGQLMLGNTGNAGGIVFKRSNDGSGQGFIGYPTAAESTNMQLRSDGGGGFITMRTAGNERMRISSDGNVGIGTTAPTEKLQVEGGNVAFKGSWATGNGPLLSLINTSGATPGTFGPGVLINSSVSGKHGYVLTQMQNAESYFTISNPSSPYNSYLAIDQSGNVGINTSIPTTKLQVYGGVRAVGGRSYNGQSAGYTFAGNGGDDDSGMFSLSDGNLSFYTNDASRVMIDPNGNVGIGTTNPTTKLHVAAGGARFNNVIVGQNASDGGMDMAWPYESVGVTTGNLRLQSPGVIAFHTYMTGTEPDDTSKQRMVIDLSGNVGIGTTDPTTKLHVVGNVTAAAYYQSSDRRLKTDIQTVGDPFALLNGIEGRHFRWKSSGKAAYGVIAQEVARVMPEAVGGTISGTQTVDYAQMVAPLIEAVKQLDKRVKALEAENRSLRAASKGH